MSNYYNSETLLEQQAEIEKLKAERDALAAQVSRMSTFVKLSAAKWENCHEVYPTFWDLLRVANEAPQQHLAEIRAEAVLVAANSCLFMASINTDDGVVNREICLFEDLEQYAELAKDGDV